jgi:hypothetical protein
LGIVQTTTQNVPDRILLQSLWMLLTVDPISLSDLPAVTRGDAGPAMVWTDGFSSVLSLVR